MKVKYWLIVVINILSLIKIFSADWETAFASTNDMWLNVSVVLVSSEILGIVGATLLLLILRMIYSDTMYTVKEFIKDVLNYKIP